MIGGLEHKVAVREERADNHDARLPVESALQGAMIKCLGSEEGSASREGFWRQWNLQSVLAFSTSWSLVLPIYWFPCFFTKMVLSHSAVIGGWGVAV